MLKQQNNVLLHPDVFLLEKLHSQQPVKEKVQIEQMRNIRVYPVLNINGLIVLKTVISLKKLHSKMDLISSSYILTLGFRPSISLPKTSSLHRINSFFFIMCGII